MASLAAPAEAEELFLKKLEYTTPIVKAATWLVRLVLHKIRDVEEVTLFGRVSDEFRQLEAVRRGDASEPATKADLKPIAALASACKHGTESANRKADTLLAVAGETAQTVKRIDRRGKKDNRRRRFTVEQQEQCFRYWELGRKNAAIKENTTGKVRYEHVFAYYRKELKALGIKDCDDFVAALGARSDRISRTRTGR